MMTSKIYKIIAVLLLILLVSLFLYSNFKIQKLQSENIELKESKRKELIRVRDSAFVKVDSIISLSSKKFDSILSIPPTIKWQKYEKLNYTDRSLDDALDVISNYEYNKKPKGKNK